jgi:hypothetical protein
MEKTFTEVMARLEKDLVANERVIPKLKKICLDIERIKAAIGELFQDPDFYMGYSLINDNFILFNKKHFPPLLAKLFFAHLHLEFERQKEFSILEAFKDWCEMELGKVKEFFARNWYLYTYWQTDQAKDDEELFWGNGKGYEPIIAPTPLHPPYDLVHIGGDGFHNAGLLTLAGLMAYEQYKEILKEELADNRPGVMKLEEVRKGRVGWSKTIRDLAEQILGQYEYRTTLVDGEAATLEFLIEENCRLFTNVTVKQLTAAIRGVTARSKGPAVHHQAIIKAMHGRHDRLLD